jgi:hypothetical protein
MLINTKTDFSLLKDVKGYERFSFVTGEKQETSIACRRKCRTPRVKEGQDHLYSLTALI